MYRAIQLKGKQEGKQYEQQMNEHDVDNERLCYPVDFLRKLIVSMHDWPHKQGRQFCDSATTSGTNTTMLKGASSYDISLDPCVVQQKGAKTPHTVPVITE